MARRVKKEKKGKKEKKLECYFFLPYLFKPSGRYNFKFEGNNYEITIEHRQNMRFFLSMVPNIGNINEIFSGFSSLKIKMEKPFKEWSSKSTNYLFEKIISVLNEFQYSYLFVSNDYMWVTVLKEHIPGMSVRDLEEEIITIIHQLDIWKRIPKDTKKEEKDKIKAFKYFIKNKDDLKLEQIYLIDSKKHYATGEYHIMYVDLGIAIEILVNKSINKIQNVNEKALLKKSGLSNQIAYILDKYCKWRNDDIEEIKTICKTRNKIIHKNVRISSTNDALKHLLITSEVINDITSWLENE